MRYCLSILSALLLLSGDLYGQNISGYIKDATSSETIAGAFVESSNGAKAISNEYGHYVITVEHSNIITFHSLGYEQYAFTARAVRDTIINVSLAPSVTYLEEVTVSRSRTNPVQFKDDGNISVNMHQLKYTPLFLGEQDVLKYLQILPGVSSGKEGSSTINVRGGSSDQTFILLDDVPLYNMAHTFGFLSIFSGNIVKSADFYKSYIPAQYGGRLSGVVSMRMKDGNRKSHHQSVIIGTISGGLTLEGPIKKDTGSYIFSARRFFPDLFLRGYYAIKKPEERILYSFYDITAKANYDIGKHNTLYFSFYIGNDSSSVTNDQLSDNKKLGYSGGGFKWGNIMSAIRLNTAVSPKTFINNTLYYSRQHNHKKSFMELYTPKNEFQSDNWSAMDEIGFKSSARSLISAYYDISCGMSGTLHFFNPENIKSNANGSVNAKSHYTTQLYTLSAFVENDIHWKKRYSVNVGLRISYYNNGKSQTTAFEPRVSLISVIANHISAHISFIKNTQPVMSGEMFYFGLPLDFWSPYKDNNLQTAYQYSLGVKSFLFNKIDFTADIYYKSLKNMPVIYDSDDYISGSGGFDHFKGQSYGLEVNAQYNSQKYGINLSYTYSRSFRIIEKEKFEFAYDAPHMVNLYGFYNTVRKDNVKHTLSVNLNYKTGLPFSFSEEVFDTGFIVGSDFYSIYFVGNNVSNFPNARLPDYFRLDISYNMERRKKNGVRNWQISILNILNRKNVYIIYGERKIEIGNVSYKQLTLIPIMPSISYSRTF